MVLIGNRKPMLPILSFICRSVGMNNEKIIITIIAILCTLIIHRYVLIGCKALNSRPHTFNNIVNSELMY